ncbi:MAG: V-type ATPase subunit [Dehalococcoidales bacterium]|nr:V-type ATPase subunit [Dehalococcoidales bacterium]
MPGIGYAFISAYLKGEEARIVKSEHFRALEKAPNYQDAVEIIRDTDVGTFLEGLDIKTFDELDQQLWVYLGQCLETIQWFKNIPVEARTILDTYVTKYDIQNIKTAIQNILTGARTPGIPAGTIFHNGYLDNLVRSANLNDVVTIVNDCGMADYAVILDQYKTEDGFQKEILTDTGLENLYFSKLINTAKKVKDSAALLKVFYTLIDMTNLQIVLRAVLGDSNTNASGKVIEGGYMLSDQLLKEILVQKAGDVSSKIESSVFRGLADEILTSFEKDHNISIIDELIDKFKFKTISDTLSPVNMSPAVVIWYIFCKETELRNVRLILKATLDNIPSEAIRSYLVYSS